MAGAEGSVDELHALRIASAKLVKMAIRFIRELLVLQTTEGVFVLIPERCVINGEARYLYEERVC